MSARNFLTVGILTIFAIGTWYVASRFETPESRETAAQGKLSGFYLRSARILGTDDQGHWLYEIEAEYAEQQANEDIELENVLLRYSDGAAVPWTINADLATIRQRQNLLTLEGHVIAVSNEGFAGQVTEIRAPYLEIDPDAYTAQTDSRVQIRIGSRSLTATGMLALLNDNRLTLRSNVSGKFVP